MPELTLEVDACFRVVLRQILQWWPCVLVPLGSGCAFDRHAFLASFSLLRAGGIVWGPTACSLLLPMGMHIQCHNHLAYALLPL